MVVSMCEALTVRCRIGPNSYTQQRLRGTCSILLIGGMAVSASRVWNFVGLHLRGAPEYWPAPGSCCGCNGIAMHAAEADATPEKWRPGPAEVYSGQAQKAMYLLRENPVLFDSSVEEELQVLQEQKEEQEAAQSSLSNANDKEDALVLRRRMSEVLQNERMRIVTELLYLKVCARFRAMNVPLIPTLKAGGDVRFGSIDLKSLTNDMYSKGALELVKEHLVRIIGQQSAGSIMGGLAVVQISLFQAGQVYAMSALFGYYLRRVDARFQLEKLAGTFGAWGDEGGGDDPEPFAGNDGELQSLKDYISKFGPQEVQSMTSIASVEAQMAMETQVTALFGDLRVLKEKLVSALGMVSSNEEATRKLEQAIQSNEVASLRITSDDLRRLVLEAVAYGALLIDMEKQADTLYELTPASNRQMGALTGDSDDEGRMLPE